MGKGSKLSIDQGTALKAINGNEVIQETVQVVKGREENIEGEGEKRKEDNIGIRVIEEAVTKMKGEGGREKVEKAGESLEIAGEGQRIGKGIGEEANKNLNDVKNY